MSYVIDGNRTFSETEDGERTLLANFNAQITKETRYHNGDTYNSVLTIEGTHASGASLPPIQVKAEDFTGMTWVTPKWGVTCVLQPGGGIKDQMRACIQLFSKPTIQIVYRHTGWSEATDKPTYLHAGGGITADGNDPTIRVELPQELSRYNLPAPNGSPVPAIQAALALTKVGPAEITWPLLAATFAPLFGQVDFALHLTGRTGTFKSELMSLFQSFYGADMDARHLPGSWSSTANALEAQAFHVKNAAFTLDDFVPSGTAWQVRSYQQTAEKIIRSQGNQAGRARLTDTSNLQATMYPRGIILSTGEDTPDGHSIRARMIILEMSPGDIKPEALTKAQAARPLYSACMSAFIQQLAREPVQLAKIAESHRNAHLGVGHTRTPAMVGYLLAVIDQFITWAQATKALKGALAVKTHEAAHKAILDVANKQADYLTSADPCDCFVETLRTAMSQGLCHVRTTNGGIPNRPHLLGWTSIQTPGDEIPNYKANGPCIGWINWSSGELYLEINAGYGLVRKQAGSEIPLTKQTMLKRLKDASLLKRVDDARQRNTIRLHAERHVRQVIAFDTEQIFTDDDDAATPEQGDAFEEE